MASDETPADTVTEQAAKVIANHSEHGACMTAECGEDLLPVPYPRNRDDRNAFWDRHIARALHDAGLLADPAERGEPYDQLDNQRNLWAKQCHEAEARAERAEAEVARLSMAKVNQRDAETEAANAVSDLATAEAELAELRATVDRVTTLRDHWAHMAGLAMDADTREWLDAASKSLRAALDGGEQP